MVVGTETAKGHQSLPHSSILYISAEKLRFLLVQRYSLHHANLLIADFVLGVVLDSPKQNMRLF
jgi:hypothetical protein